MYVKEKIYPAYVSKNNSNHEKQVILLMIPNGEGFQQSKTLATGANPKGHKAKFEVQQWYYFAVKNC